MKLNMRMRGQGCGKGERSPNHYLRRPKTVEVHDGTILVRSMSCHAKMHKHTIAYPVHFRDEVVPRCERGMQSTMPHQGKHMRTPYPASMRDNGVSHCHIAVMGSVAH
ncbi:hypothetical protein HAX54_047621 [Datura stramonium]|uniref:Uncharacterized protein n=1 Tax=Datura stramonium TaxID=4076 RepID=A0ABS8ST87_DATST|nr:hypothetical protein [Datura stramonium]